MLNLDTHIVLFALAGDLRKREEELLARHPWSISSIVLWEITKLAELGRIDVDLNDAELNRILARLHVWPLSWQICRAIEGLDLKSDPADKIIAATSVVHGIPLVTRDRRLRSARDVPTAP